MTLTPIVTLEPDPVLYESCADEGENPPTPEEIVSDAILKPKIVWIDGFGGGTYQEDGFCLPDDQIPNPVLGSIIDPITGQLGAFTDITAVGRYYAPYASPLWTQVPVPGGGNMAITKPQKSWLQFSTGGRGGRGFIRSVTDEDFEAGHWKGITFPPGSNLKAGGILIGIKSLNNVTIPSNDLNIIGFVTAFLLKNVSTATFERRWDAIPHVVIAIDPDRFIVAKRFDLVSTPITGNSGIEPNPHSIGDWVEIGRSVVQVPASASFSLEAGIYLSSYHSFTNQIVENGFVYVRLYTNNILGSRIIFEQDIRTLGWLGSVNLEGISWGTDVTGLAGDGAGTLTKGVANVDIDSIVVFTHDGTVKKNLYDCRVGTSKPISIVTSESTPSSGTIIDNVARDLNDLSDINTYNILSASQKDIYNVEPARIEAKEILAVSVYNYHDPLLSGEGETSLKFGSAEVVLDQVFYGATRRAQYLIIEETNIESTINWVPGDISNVKPGIRNSFTDSINVYQLGIEYLYRESIIIETELPPIQPRASFGFTAVSGTSYAFMDTSVGWDGTLIHNHWDFGDGGTADDVGRLYAGEGVVDHNYTTSGDKIVTLTVHDSNGLVATKTHTITVANQAPTANFSFAANPSDLTNKTVDFTDTSTDPDGTVVAWNWDFGDGSPHSFVRNPTHAYSAPGTPLVSLTVTDNIGATDIVTQEVDIPIGGGGDCGLSATAQANTAGVQGDDYVGGNPPLPSYADTDAYWTYYAGFVYRKAYNSAFSFIHDNVDFFIDNSVQFNGRHTLRTGYNATHFGAGWNTFFSNDGDPTETNAPTLEQWMRVRWKSDAGVMSQAGVLGIFSGLNVLEMIGNSPECGLYIRNGRLNLDVGADANTTYDIGNENLFVGASGFGDLAVRWTGNNGAHTLRLMVWATAACALSGASPIKDVTVASAGDNTLPKCNWFDCLFTPTGATKYLWIADWETMAASVDANPFGVSFV